MFILFKKFVSVDASSGSFTIIEVHLVLAYKLLRNLVFFSSEESNWDIDLRESAVVASSDI